MRFAGLLTPSFGPRSPAFAAMIEGTSGEDWYMPVIPTKPLRIALFIAYGNLCGEQYGGHQLKLHFMVLQRGIQWPGWNRASLSLHPLMKSYVEVAKRR